MKLKNISLKLKQFVIKNYLKILLVVVPPGAILVIGSLIGYDQTTNFCYSCHFNKGPYVYINRNLPVHKDIDQNIFSCTRCHKDKTVQTIYGRDLKKYKNYSERVANLSFTDPINPRGTYTTDQCLICHPDRLDVDERELYLLKSDKLREIGLRFSKRLHYRFEDFNLTDQKLYQELASKNSLSKVEQQELELLEKIKLGNCGQCHRRVKKEPDDKTSVDKQVNFIARNPITCAGCHEDVDPLSHPGQPLVTPSEETCQKCHHGKIHGKFLIFRAECEDLSDQTNCKKCHPYYVSEKIGNYGKR